MVIKVNKNRYIRVMKVKKKQVHKGYEGKTGTQGL